MQGAAKVGLLVVVFVALFYGAYAVLGRTFLAEPKNVYYAEFPDAGGVTKGTAVLLAGVQVGTVRAIDLMNPKLARMTFEIDADVRIPEGSSALLPASLISLGEQPVTIVPPEQLPGSYLAAGDTMPGGRGNPLDNILPHSKETVNELNKTLAATRKILEDKELFDEVKSLIRTSNETLAKFGGIADESRAVLAENRGTINRALDQAALAVADVREATSMVARISKEGKFEGRALELMDRLNSIAAKTDELVASLDTFVNDPNLRTPLNETMANVSKITDSGTRIAASTEKIAANGEVISAKAIEFADKANELATEAKKVLEDLRGFFGKGPKTGGLGPIDAELDLLRETDPAYWRTDINFTVPLPDSRVHFGLYDAFESNKLNVQLSRNVGADLRYRYGIYASKPGVGVDYRVANRLSVRGDLFDINDPRFDLRARYEFGNGLYGWLGVNRIFDANAPTIGVGIRK